MNRGLLVSASLERSIAVKLPVVLLFLRRFSGQECVLT